MTIGSSGSWKTHAFLNLINEQDDIVKFYLYAKDLSEPKNEFLIKKCKDVETKHLKYPNAIIGCSNTMDDVHENIGGSNQTRKRKVLIVFDDMIADILS